MVRVGVRWSCKRVRVRPAWRCAGRRRTRSRALGRALWRKKRLIGGLTLLAAGLAFAGVNLVTPRYRSEARVLIETRENIFLRPDAEKTARARHHRRPGSGDQPGPAHPVARSRARGHQEAQARRAAGIRSGAARQIVPAGRPRPHRHRQGPDEHDAGRARAQKLFRAAVRVPGRKVARDRDRVRIRRIPSSPRRSPTRSPRATSPCSRPPSRSRPAPPARGSPARSTSLRKKVADAEAKVEQYRAKTNLFIGTNNTTLSNQQLGDFNAQLAAARAQKSDAEAKARLIRDMLRTGAPIEFSDIINSELMRRLSEQRVTLRAQLAEQSSTLLDQHPRIKELRAQIADLERQMRGEADRLARSLENDAKLAERPGRWRSAPASTSSSGRRPRPTSRTCSCARSSAMPNRSAICSNPISPSIAKRPRATASARPRRTRASSRPRSSRTRRPGRRSCRPCWSRRSRMLALSVGFVLTGEQRRPAAPGRDGRGRARTFAAPAAVGARTSTMPRMAMPTAGPLAGAAAEAGDR